MTLRALALVLLLGATCAIASSSAVDAASPRANDAAQVVTRSNGTVTHSDGATARSDGSAAAPITQPSSGIGAPTAIADPIANPPDWLIEINRYRAAAGLAPVVDQPTWDAGILAHLTYVAKTPKSDLIGKYASLHTENPASPYYTRDGALEASRSDLFFGSANVHPVAFVDGWLSAPFHAIGVLRAKLTQVAFATAPGGAAGLDVISGLDDDRPAATSPILFPGNGMTTNLASYTGGESPDPLETCGWPAGGSYGLPLIALLTQAPSTSIRASVTSSDGTVRSTDNGQLCLVDEVTYRSSDPVYGPTGGQLLQDDHAVLLIARGSYIAGGYSARITQAGQSDLQWSFTVAP